MLVIQARVGLSSIQGLGLMAQQFIPKGAVIWRYAPGFDIEISESDLSSLSPAARAQVTHYAEYFPDQRMFVLSGDDDRFTNHSDIPNTRQRGEIGQPYQIVYAAKDIAIGEEITCDYREIKMFAHLSEQMFGEVAA
jgi:uncharacterized protein